MKAFYFFLKDSRHSGAVQVYAFHSYS